MRLRDPCHAQPEQGAVPDCRLNRVAGFGRDHDPDFLDARSGDVLEDEEQNGLVRNRDELLGRRVRDRSEASPFAPAQDQTFQTRAHPNSPSSVVTDPPDSAAVRLSSRLTTWQTCGSKL